MLTTCWLLPIPSPSRLDAFGWTRSQLKLPFLLGRPRGGRSSPLIGLKNEDGGFLIAVFCVVVKRKMQITFFYTVVLWEIVLALFRVHWVFPETVKEVLLSWRSPFVGRKRKKIWYSIPLCIFWMVWKERNRLTFRGGSLDIQKLKNSFVYNLWSWARVYMGEESSSLLVFLEWLAAT